MPTTEVPTNTSGLTNMTIVTTPSAKPTTATEASSKSTTKPTKIPYGEPSPSYKRNIDISKFSVSLHYLLHVV